MAGIALIGNSGVIADVDANRNIATSEGIPAHPAAGGFYTVSGQTTAAVAVSLAANTPLMTMRFSASSTRKAYVTKMRLLIGASAVGASALVPGTVALQRFTAATPSGGTARTANRLNEASGTVTDMTDIRDSAAALTVTSVVFGNIAGNAIVPLFITSGPMWYEWQFEPFYPLILGAGDGLSLRTSVAMPATQTWVYSYTTHWFEK